MAIQAAFEEEELNRLYTEVAVGGPSYQTAVVGNPKGVEQLSINQFDAIRPWEINYGGMSQSEKLSLEEFFLTKWGQAIGFRFYPPSDRNFQNDVIGIGTGAATVFYLRRNYRSRSRFISRRIVKPVKDTIVITVDGTPVTPSTVNWDEGIVTLSSAPAAGAIVRCESGQYDVPVRFMVDDFNATDYGNFADWNSIKVKEILPSQLTNSGLGVTPLSLAFTAPHSNDVFEDEFDVTLSHSGCTKVFLYVGNSLFGSDASAPFSFADVPVPILTDEGRFTVTALGIDGSGNFVEAQIELNTEALPTGIIQGVIGGVTEIDGGYWL